jgi:type VI secretion system secreted protein VgrG
MYIGTRHLRRSAAVLVALAITASLLLTPVPSGAGAVTTPVGLGTAGAYSVLAGQAVTNDGASTLHGSLGLHPNDETSVTGFTFSTPPGLGQVLGDVNTANDAALQAKNALTTAYGDAAGRTLTSAPTAALADTTLFAGVHGSAAALTVSGTLTLDAQGDPTSVFIIKAETAELTIASGASVQLIGDAQACNVFWQVGSSAAVGTSASFVGTILAQTSISVNTGATIEGRALAQTGEVTLLTNTIFQPGCDLAAGGDDTTTSTAGGDDTTTTTAGDDDDLPATGAGPVLPVLIGGLALLAAGGGTMVFAKRRRADLR